MRRWRKSKLATRRERSRSPKRFLTIDTGYTNRGKYSVEGADSSISSWINPLLLESNSLVFFFLFLFFLLPFSFVSSESSTCCISTLDSSSISPPSNFSYDWLSDASPDDPPFTVDCFENPFYLFFLNVRMSSKLSSLSSLPLSSLKLVILCISTSYCPW